MLLSKILRLLKKKEIRTLKTQMTSSNKESSNLYKKVLKKLYILDQIRYIKETKKQKKTNKLGILLKNNDNSQLSKTIFNFLYSKRNLKKDNLVSYVVNIRLSPTNTLVTVTDIKGNVKLSYSAGSVNIKGKQKVRYPTTLISILKVLVTKSGFLKNKPIAIHFRNLPTNYELFITNMLKSRFFIKVIRSYNLRPHNGCRPKKIRRIKRRTSKF